jgi:pimeloyl-ACP methyl ester carboxylesterase
MPQNFSMSCPSILPRHDGATIAYRRFEGCGPGVVFLGGFRSGMTGIKASFLEEYCRRHGRAYVRFDYFGHGASSGDVGTGTIGRWSEDAIAVLDALTEGRQILIGASMGGWIMIIATAGNSNLLLNPLYGGETAAPASGSQSGILTLP